MLQWTNIKINNQIDEISALDLKLKRIFIYIYIFPWNKDYNFFLQKFSVLNFILSKKLNVKTKFLD